MSKNTIKDSYKGFDLISETEVPDCSSIGVYLRHRKTGLEVFHLLNDDEENLFAFAFRTPIKDSTGAAHITEHSVFCGSEKFPLKEPFTNMMNQSVNTFLNALTYSDKTVYPASSTVKADYFNLMDVYGDAVFFPLLKEEAFHQEAHRIEIDENGKPSIQGVVYNEMKGSYSSFESVATDLQIRSLFPDTNYAYDSGGDPLSIPEFSYEDFKAFHKKYYRPDNCLVFLYGNVPTEEQLDYLQSHFLDRLEEKFKAPESNLEYFARMETPEVQTKPINLTGTAPATGATGSTVTVNWLCGLTKNLTAYSEAAFMVEVLAGHDGSPLSKALIESNLGDDMAPLSGVLNETRFFSLAFGMHGVKRCNEKKVFKLIFKKLEEICRNGIDPRDVEAALMCAEFSNREVVRAGGPYSMVLLDRALNGWNYGRSPAEMLLVRAEFDKIRQNVKDDPDYVVNLIQRFMLDNDRRSYVVVRPSKKFLKNRDKKEKVLLKKLVKNADMEKVQKELEALHAYQNHHETPEEVACIPSLDLKDLKTEFERIETKVIGVKQGDSEIPVFTNKEGTNGIGYLEVCYPLDSLSPEDYPYLPFFSYCASNIGWNGKNWSECAEETAVHTGGIYTRLLTSSCADTERSKKLIEKLSGTNYINRDWIIFSVRYLDEKLEDALNVFAESLAYYDFDDQKRLKTLLGEALSSIKSAVIPKGNRYASKRVQCTKNHSCAVDEIWNGLAQLFFMNRLSKDNTENIAAKFRSIKEKLMKAGAVVHLTADENTLNISMKKMPEFVNAAKLLPPSKPVQHDEKDFLKLLVLPGEGDSVPQDEMFVIDSQVGYAAATLEASYFGQKENSGELVLAHWLSGTSLWEKIRTTGGAYGAYAGCSNLAGLFNFTTFRDPTPAKSIETIKECIKDAVDAEFTEEECNRSITGTYGDEVQPHSPYGRGTAGFFRTIYCIDEDDRNDKLVNLLAVKPQDVKAAAKRLSEKVCGMKTAVLSNNKTIKNTSVIINLPL